MKVNIRALKEKAYYPLPVFRAKGLIPTLDILRKRADPTREKERFESRVGSFSGIV